MVTVPFNADFDGDQMAVHVPLSSQARFEADEIMLASHNLLKPSDGRPSTSATQDVVLGLYYISKPVADALGSGQAYSGVNEAVVAYQLGSLAVNALIRIADPRKKQTVLIQKILTSIAR
jgi:DNA-directed RNA polymerase subunit beta'